MTANVHEPLPLPAFTLPAWDGPPARLSLVRPGGGPVRIDGAWWPRSRDLAKELPPLLAVLDSRWGRISYLTVEDSAWLDGPAAMVLGGHTLRINRSVSANHRNAVCLLCPGVGRCDLVVLPPETATHQARGLMAAAVVRL
jgi:Family of unknown function (DUF5994)